MHSVWITASAGTGKTKSLVDRVLFLLLSGHKNIVCVTFTNAAAKEMLERIAVQLRSWVLLDDHSLRQSISKFTDNHNLSYARSLFYRLSELLVINTIHAFCYKILQQFPIESGLPYDVKILEYQEELYLQALNIFLSTNPDLGKIASTLTNRMLLRLLTELIPKMQFHELYQQHLQQLQDDTIDIELCDYTEIIKVLRQGSKRDNKHADLLEQQNAYKVFINSDGYKKQIKSIITQALLTNFSHIETLITKAQEQYYLWYEQQQKLTVITRTKAILRIIKDIYDIYNNIKQGYISYDEVISHTLKLLQDPQHHAWVMCNLSNNITHLLIDEAQDNSLEQWEIIRLLSEDFFSGLGINNMQNTLFVVGDSKQSIYRFQGAQPQLLQTMYQYFTEKAAYFEQKIKVHSLDVSYRSTSSILQLVDKIFNDERFAESMINQHVQHKCHRNHDVGHIELWPLAESNDQLMTWEIGQSIQDEKADVAIKIANQIATWLQNQRQLNDRKITVDDIIILVRKRSTFIHDLATALQKHNIPVHPYDRFTITDHLIVKDLISLGQVLLSPHEYELELLNLLKSSLIAAGEEQIFTLCYNREEASIYTRLMHCLPEIYRKIERWRSIAGNTFEIYYQIIKEESFAPQHHDIFDKFLDLAFGKPVLAEFLHFMQTHDIEIKSNAKQGIRIMTVHNAKGLEAPIVFLADTTDIPKLNDKILWDGRGIPFYLQSDNFAQLKEQESHEIYNEYIRLLYVALTRARDELYITGWDKSREQSWYNIIADNLEMSG